VPDITKPIYSQAKSILPMNTRQRSCAACHRTEPKNQAGLTKCEISHLRCASKAACRVRLTKNPKPLSSQFL